MGGLIRQTVRDMMRDFLSQVIRMMQMTKVNPVFPEVRGVRWAELMLACQDDCLETIAQ